MRYLQKLKACLKLCQVKFKVVFYGSLFRKVVYRQISALKCVSMHDTPKFFQNNDVLDLQLVSVADPGGSIP